jgi:hypothetical protein
VGSRGARSRDGARRACELGRAGDEGATAHYSDPMWPEIRRSPPERRCQPRPVAALGTRLDRAATRSRPDLGRVIELPEVGGLHHRYVRKAA